jgi:putative flippase GtrA
MLEEATAARAPLPLHRRVRHGLRRPHNWIQLIRFALVGASGYVVNLGTFAALVHGAGLDYRLAAVLSFLLAVTSNWWWNRVWTFKVRGAGAHFQAIRFLVVSVVTFGVTFGVLSALVELAGMAKVPAQAIAIVSGLPLNFLGQKLWSFRT